jgi:hypothetical protein
MKAGQFSDEQIVAIYRKPHVVRNHLSSVPGEGYLSSDLLRVAQEFNGASTKDVQRLRELEKRMRV